MRTANLDAADPSRGSEGKAADFMRNLKDAVGSDEDATQTLTDFTSLFMAMREGEYSPNVTRNLVVDLLNDAAPTMIEEFLSIFPRCYMTDTWAGFAALDGDGGRSGEEAFTVASEALAEEGRGSGGAEAGGAAAAEGARTPGGAAAAAGQASAREGGGKAKDWRSISKTLVPYGRGSYALWFTIINVSAIIGIFAYMMGDYALWVRTNPERFQQNSNGNNAQAALELEEISTYPGDVRKYVTEWLTWTGTWQDFHSDFLRAWGGRYGPGLKDGEWWLWVTSIYVHRDLQHIVSNMLLFVVMSVHLELNYGWWRMLLVWVMSGVGANFISAVFEDSRLLVGASGAVFGFMGLFVADLIVNFESIAWPFVRAFTIVLFLGFFVVNAILENNRQRGQVSHASHIGGLICGIFPSLLFLPNLRDKRLAAVRRELRSQNAGATTRRHVLGEPTPSGRPNRDGGNHGLKPSFWSRFPINPLRIVAVIVIIIVYIVFPIYLYKSKLKEEDEDSPTITSIQSPEPPAGDPDLPDPVGPPTEGIATDAPSTRRLLEVGWNLVVPAEYRATRG